MATISDRIFTILKEKHVSQKAFAALSGIPESTISDWKHKDLNPAADKLPAITRALGCSVDRLLGMDVDSDRSEASSDESGHSSESALLELYRQADEDVRARLIAYARKLCAGDIQESTSPAATAVSSPSTDISSTDHIPYEADTDFLVKKQLAFKLRRLGKLGRVRLDESEHSDARNLHLFRYLDYCGLDRLDFVKMYLSNIQPFMITELSSQEKFENAVCVLDSFYRISLYIKADTTAGEEVIVSFHENHRHGIARNNFPSGKWDYIYVIADSISSVCENVYTVNLFIARGVRTFPITVAATRYDTEGFLVRYRSIENELVELVNRYLADLFTSDLDLHSIELFTALEQLSFTSYGRDCMSNISLLIDSLLVQKNDISRQTSDAALCIYCNSLQLTDFQKKELIDTLKLRFSVNSAKVIPMILERIESQIPECIQ